MQRKFAKTSIIMKLHSKRGSRLSRCVKSKTRSVELTTDRVFALLNTLHIHQHPQVAEALIVLRLRNGIFLTEGIESLFLLAE